MGLINGFNSIFSLFYFLIILRIFLSWVPTINWEANPWFTIRQVTDGYLNIFRRVIPPYRGLDFSPIIAIIVLEILRKIVVLMLLFIFKV